MKLPKQSANVIRAPFGAVSPVALHVQPANPLNWLCRWFDLPWCRPSEPCYYNRTETKCWFFVLMCKNHGWTASGRSCSGGWYACGACIGLPF